MRAPWRRGCLPARAARIPANPPGRARGERGAILPNRWLLKTEPGEYSFEQLLREGRTVWDGVTNPLALRHLRAIRPGDPLLIYHTGGVRAAVGLARAASEPYPDPAQADPRRVVVDVVPVRPLPHPVPLASIKADPRFRAFDLVRLPRLSVMPVPGPLWQTLMAMGGAGEP